MRRYILLIHQGEAPTPQAPAAWEQLPEQDREAITREYRMIRETPGVTVGAQMTDAEMATTVSVRDGETLVTDGPFVEMKEALGGYLLYDAEDLDAAIELASRIPAARLGGAVEIRPLLGP